MASASGQEMYRVLQDDGSSSPQMSAKAAGKARAADPAEAVDNHAQISARKPVSRGKKAVAACTGAVITSVTMTPFDVIKTRLQTQVNPEPLFVPSSRPTAAPATKSLDAALPQSSAFRAKAHPATCCQATFFTANTRGPGMMCVHDPRLEAIGLNQRPALAASGSQHLASIVKNSTHPSGKGNIASAGAQSSSTSSIPAVVHRSRPFPTSSKITHTSAFYAPLSQPPSAPKASTAAICAFPDRGVAARELERAAADSRLTGLWDGVVKVGRTEGVRGLWRGLSPTLMMTVPSQVTYMTCYDHFRALFLSWEKTPPPLVGRPMQPSLEAVTTHSLLASLAAGALSRTISATLVTPLELLRTRLQATQASTSASAGGGAGGAQNLRALLAQLGREVSRAGPTVLFRGLAPTLWRDVPFSALYFMGYESLKRIMTGGGLGEGNAAGGAEEFTVAFVGGAVSGTVAAVATHPFDVVKTRLQAAAVAGGAVDGSGAPRQGKRDGAPRGVVAAAPSSRQARAAPSSSAAADGLTSPKPTGTRAALRSILREEGAAGLLRGLSPRVAKVAPACGMMIASFEVVGRVLAEAT